MNSYINDWVTKLGKVAREFKLAIYQFECDALTPTEPFVILYYM